MLRYCNDQESTANVEVHVAFNHPVTYLSIRSGMVRRHSRRRPRGSCIGIWTDGNQIKLNKVPQKSSI
jgi:hypothetical protein